MNYSAGRMEMKRTSPNDASGIIWAIGEFLFFIYFVFFSNTNLYFIVYTL